MSSLNRVDRAEEPRPVASTTTLEGLWLGELLPVTNPVRIPFVFSFLDHPVSVDCDPDVARRFVE